MICAISGEPPVEPVVSRKSGNLFEKRLIEAHISEHHTDPVTGEDLETEDLVVLKTPRIVRPRPPTITSIPSLLQAFQNEWDAIALETFNLKKQLAQTRQELSTALYHHEAATRVIQRLMKERDEARDALSKVTVDTTAGASNGDAMQVDEQELPAELAAKVQAVQEKLSSTRRKRPVPEDWATPDDIQGLDSVDSIPALYPGSRTLALNKTGDMAILGGTEGVAGVYSISEKRVVNSLNYGGGVVTAAIWAEDRAIIASSSGSIKVFDGESEVGNLRSHAGAATSLAVHPCGDILASTGVDKSFLMHDLRDLKTVSHVNTESELLCGEFHPDGHLYAAGGKDGQIKIFNVVSGTSAAVFESEGIVQTLSFSENGTMLASATKGQTSVAIWDLRKPNVIKVLDIGSVVEKVHFDYTGQYALTAGAGCVTVQQYTKASKSWSEPFRKAVTARDALWGPSAKSLMVLKDDGTLSIFN